MSDGGSEDVLWSLTDHINSVRDLASHVSGATNITNHRVYDAFGNLTSETAPAVDCIFGYTGRLWDEDTGLQNNLNRWYDPAVGRWLSEDPIGYFMPYVADDDYSGVWSRVSNDLVDVDLIVNDLNLYRYVGNKPLDHFDATGEAGHKKKRPSTKDKHTKPRPGRSNTKQRKKPGWRDNKTGTIVKYVGVGVGIGIIIGTIIEDVATGGIGIADDPASFAVGGAMICAPFASPPPDKW